MNFFILEPVIWLLFFIFVFYASGSFFTENLLKTDQWPEKLFVNVVLGFGFIIIILTFLALFQMLYLGILLILFMSILVVFLVKNITVKPYNVRINTLYQGMVSHAGLLFILIFWLAPEAFRIFFPETRSDAMRYHLPYARFYAENHGLIVNEFSRYPLFTHNINMVFSLGYIFQKFGQAEILARLFHFFSFTLLTIGLYSFVSKSFNKLMALIACFLLLNTKIVHIYIVAGYIDFGLALFVFACVYFLYLWQHEQQQKWLLFSATMLGLALGTKYLALIWLVPMIIWVYAIHKNWKEAYRFLMVSMIIGGFWYVRNAIISGNPIHPFAQNVFGYWLWTAQDVIFQKRDLLDLPGVPKTFLNLIKLPWILATDKQFRYDKLGWVLISGIPFTLFAFKMQRFFKVMAIFLILNLVFWFYSSQFIRYFFSLLPFLAIFAAYPFGLLYEKIGHYRFVKNKYLIQIVAVGLIAVSINSSIKTYISWNKWKALPNSTFEWEKYLFKTNKNYLFSKTLNDLNAKRVLKLSKAKLQNTFKGVVLGDWFGCVNMRAIVIETKSVDQLVQRMKSLDTHFVIVDKKHSFFNRINKIINNDTTFKIIQESESSVLYELNKSAQ